jgi:hypothetical protein
MCGCPHLTVNTAVANWVHKLLTRYIAFSACGQPRIQSTLFGGLTCVLFPFYQALLSGVDLVFPRNMFVVPAVQQGDMHFIQHALPAALLLCLCQLGSGCFEALDAVC